MNSFMLMYGYQPRAPWLRASPSWYCGRFLEKIARDARVCKREHKVCSSPYAGRTTSTANKWANSFTWSTHMSSFKLLTFKSMTFSCAMQPLLSFFYNEERHFRCSLWCPCISSLYLMIHVPGGVTMHLCLWWSSHFTIWSTQRHSSEQSCS